MDMLILLGPLFALAGIVWLLKRLSWWLAHPRFKATNEMERLLEAAIDTQESSPALENALVNSKLLAMHCSGHPDSPMTFSAMMPSSGFSGNHLAAKEDYEVKEFGPYILAFTSAAVMEEVLREPVFSMVLREFEFGELDGRHLLEAAVQKNVELMLNPFFDIRMTFTVPQIQAILEECPNV